MGIDDIIIFGVTVLLLVISGIAGARKKRREGGATKPPAPYSEAWNGMDDDSAYDQSTSGRPAPDEAVEWEPMVRRTPVGGDTFERRYASTDQWGRSGETAAPDGFIGEHMLASGIPGDRLPQEGIPAFAGGGLSAKTSSDALKTAPADPHRARADEGRNELSEVMKGFDLEKAVIYSEILKPKFDEY